MRNRNNDRKTYRTNDRETFVQAEREMQSAKITNFHLRQSINCKLNLDQRNLNNVQNERFRKYEENLLKSLNIVNLKSNSSKFE